MIVSFTMFSSTVVFAIMYGSNSTHGKIFINSFVIREKCVLVGVTCGRLEIGLSSVITLSFSLGIMWLYVNICVLEEHKSFCCFRIVIAGIGVNC